jgi:hypothetical protein
LYKYCAGRLTLKIRTWRQKEKVYFKVNSGHDAYTVGPVVSITFPWALVWFLINMVTDCSRQGRENKTMQVPQL